MPKYTLPVYAIVELLIRLSQHDESIGDYKTHKVYDDHAMVITTGGAIRLPAQLVIKQFEAPELITDEILAETAAALFVPSAVRIKTI